MSVEMPAENVSGPMAIWPVNQCPQPATCWPRQEQLHLPYGVASGQKRMPFRFGKWLSTPTDPHCGIWEIGSAVFQSNAPRNRFYSLRSPRIRGSCPKVEWKFINTHFDGLTKLISFDFECKCLLCGFCGPFSRLPFGHREKMHRNSVFYQFFHGK